MVVSWNIQFHCTLFNISMILYVYFVLRATLYSFIYIYTHAYTCTFFYMYQYVYIFICMYVCMYVCMYIHVYPIMNLPRYLRYFNDIPVIGIWMKSMMEWWPHIVMSLELCQVLVKREIVRKGILNYFQNIAYTNIYINTIFQHHIIYTYDHVCIWNLMCLLHGHLDRPNHRHVWNIYSHISIFMYIYL